jgi:hypothetical protein
MAPLLEKSPDLDNSSPMPRALMYVASLQTFGLSSSSSSSSRRGWLGTDERSWRNWRNWRDWRNWKDWTLRIQTWFTDFYWALFEWFLCFVSLLRTAVLLLPTHWPTPLSWRSCTSTAHPFYPSTIATADLRDVATSARKKIADYRSIQTRNKQEWKRLTKASSITAQTDASTIALKNGLSNTLLSVKKEVTKI